MASDQQDQQVDQPMQPMQQDQQVQLVQYRSVIRLHNTSYTICRIKFFKLEKNKMPIGTSVHPYVHMLFLICIHSPDTQ